VLGSLIIFKQWFVLKGGGWLAWEEYRFFYVLFFFFVLVV